MQRELVTAMTHLLTRCIKRRATQLVTSAGAVNFFAHVRSLVEGSFLDLPLDALVADGELTIPGDTVDVALSWDSPESGPYFVGRERPKQRSSSRLLDRSCGKVCVHKSLKKLLLCGLHMKQRTS
jgi:hypothetical protein